jgi:hypothetical protein
MLRGEHTEYEAVKLRNQTFSMRLFIWNAAKPLGPRASRPHLKLAARSSPIHDLRFTVLFEIWNLES